MRFSGGYLSGLLGVAIFSFSLPATKIAEIGFTPVFLTGARGAIAALVGTVLLGRLAKTLPQRADLVPLVVVAAGVVVGFPLLTAIALQSMTTTRSIVWTGLLPLCTAIFALLRGKEQPAPTFWLFAVAGAASVVGFALHGDGTGTPNADLLMIAAVVLCGLGYAEGATLSRRLGGWQVISWALILALPVTTGIAVATRPRTWSAIPPSAWLSLAYVSLFSAMLGFVFWYRGLAAGGTARVGQLQLLQPFGGLALTAWVVGEPVPRSAILTTLIVVVCILGARSARNGSVRERGNEATLRQP